MSLEINYRVEFGIQTADLPPGAVDVVIEVPTTVEVPKESYVESELGEFDELLNDLEFERALEAYLTLEDRELREEFTINIVF